MLHTYINYNIISAIFDNVRRTIRVISQNSTQITTTFRKIRLTEVRVIEVPTGNLSNKRI